MDTEEDYEQELPLLGWIAGFLRWLEELIVLVSGPLLMVGLGIGLVALLSDGSLLVTAPWLLYAWRSRRRTALTANWSARGIASV